MKVAGQKGMLEKLGQGPACSKAGVVAASAAAAERQSRSNSAASIRTFSLHKSSVDAVSLDSYSTCPRGRHHATNSHTTRAKRNQWSLYKRRISRLRCYAVRSYRLASA